MQNAVVIYETLTGNTRKAGERIAHELTGAGVATIACPTAEIDYPALAAADIVIVGTWTDGMVLFGQRPGRAGRLWNSIPALDRKRTALYCTYAVAPGKTLAKLETMLTGHNGANVIGGLAIRRNRIGAGAETFVDRLLALTEPAEASTS